MDSPRLAGGTSTTFLPSIRICPPVTSSSPAIRRKSVVFPQPDGPTKTTKEPSSISRLASLMMLTGCGKTTRSEEHTSELQSHSDLVCRLLLEKKKKRHSTTRTRQKS